MSLPECPLAAIGVALDRPVPGHFAIRLGSRKPWTPALIYLPCPFIEPDPFGLDGPDPADWFTPLDRAPNPLRAQVGERTIEAPEMIIKVWQGARAVTPEEHAYLVARRAWARRYDPQSYHARAADIRVLKNRELL